MVHVLSDCSIADMAVHLNVLLILTGLAGTYSITTVSKMSVKIGNSITVPCLYSPQYRDHVKYLCKGGQWLSCSTKVRTDETQVGSAKFSISDDKIQTIFMVTMKDLMLEDTGYYRCVVEIDGGGDVREGFELSVVRGVPSVFVDHQKLTGFNGEQLTVNCHGNSGKMKWCRLGPSCVSTKSGLIDGTNVTITFRGPNVNVVTMSGLRTESSGWYLCDIKDVQMPVHVTVTERPTVTKRPTTTTLATTLPTIPTPTVKSGQDSASNYLTSLVISLSLLISIVLVALFIWLKVKKQKRTKAGPSNTTMVEEEVTYSNIQHKKTASGQTEEEGTYCNVGYMNKTSGQGFAESNVDILYSSVVPKKKQNVKKVEAEDKVTYSTLAHHH